MVIGDEIDGLALLLHLDGRLHRAEIIAEMQRAGGLDAGENDLHDVSGQSYQRTARRKKARGAR